MHVLSERLSQGIRRVEGEEGRFRVTYWLCRDATPSGAAVFYLRCHLLGWRPNGEVYEEMEVVGLGADEDLARQFFRRAVDGAVFPVHLAEVAADAGPRMTSGVAFRSHGHLRRLPI